MAKNRQFSALCFAVPAVFFMTAASASQLTLSPCHKPQSEQLSPTQPPSSGNQTFALVTVPPYVSPAALATAGGSLCVTIADASPGEAISGSAVGLRWCATSDMHSRANEYWAVRQNALQSLQARTPLCLGIDGAAAELTDCSSAAAQFTVGFGAHGGRAGPLVHKQSGLCVTVDGLPPPPPPPSPPRPPPPSHQECPSRSRSTATSAEEAASRAAVAAAAAGAPPGDVYDAAGAPVVAAHSMVRALYSKYDGPLYMVKRW